MQKFWFDANCARTKGAIEEVVVKKTGRADILLSNGGHVRLLLTMALTVDIDYVSRYGLVSGFR